MFVNADAERVTPVGWLGKRLNLPARGDGLAADG